jgi:hypothetical protein
MGLTRFAPHLRSVLVLTGAVLCSACFQFSTVVSIKPDGSGTIDQHLLFTQAAVAQLRQFAALGGGTAGEFDPVSEQQARDAAATLGTGVTYVSSTPINSPEGVGRDIKYAFTDVSTLKLDQAPPAPGGMPSPAPQAAGSEPRVSFTLARQPDGNALLTVKMPQLPAVGGDNGAPFNGPTADQLAMLKPMLAGARLTIAIEPTGRLVRTSSPYVTGNRVTLLDLNVDALLADDSVLQRLRGAQTPAEAKTILQGVPGLKANLDPELTIEFQ